MINNISGIEFGIKLVPKPKRLSARPKTTNTKKN